MVPRVNWRCASCVLAIVGMLWMTGCISPSSPSAAGANVSLDNNANGQTLSAVVGDQIRVTLQTIGPGAYETSPSVSAPAIVFVTSSLVSPPNPGGPTQLFQFKAAAAGRAVISIPHTGQSPVFELTVDVR